MYKGFSVVFLLLMNLPLVAQVPVMLHVSRNNTSTAAITNLTEELASLVYPLIINEEITLWDSPRKQVQVTLQKLESIEKGSGTVLTAATDLFIHEIWYTTKKTIDVDIIGITLTHRDRTGRETSFGFIDYQSLLPHLKTYINVNENGTYPTTFEHIFLNKLYDFNVVQYENNVVKSLVESSEIIKKNFENKKLAGAKPIPPIKRVVYTIDKSTAGNDVLDKNTQSALFAFEKFISGDTALQNQFPVNHIHAIEVEEQWIKNSSGVIKYQPLNLEIISDGRKYSLPYAIWSNSVIMINDKPAEEFFKEKKFIFTIIKINNKEISKNEAGLYQKALYNHDWSNLSSYVKNF